MKKLFSASWIFSKVLFFFVIMLPLVSAEDSGFFDFLDVFFDLPGLIIGELANLISSIFNAPITHSLTLVKFLF